MPTTCNCDSLQYMVRKEPVAAYGRPWTSNRPSDQLEAEFEEIIRLKRINRAVRLKERNRKLFSYHKESLGNTSSSTDLHTRMVKDSLRRSSHENNGIQNIIKAVISEIRREHSSKTSQKRSKDDSPEIEYEESSHELDVLKDQKREIQRKIWEKKHAKNIDMKSRRPMLSKLEKVKQRYSDKTNTKYQNLIACDNISSKNCAKNGYSAQSVHNYKKKHVQPLYDDISNMDTMKGGFEFNHRDTIDSHAQRRVRTEATTNEQTPANLRSEIALHYRRKKYQKNHDKGTNTMRYIDTDNASSLFDLRQQSCADTERMPKKMPLSSNNRTYQSNEYVKIITKPLNSPSNMIKASFEDSQVTNKVPDKILEDNLLQNPVIVNYQSFGKSTTTGPNSKQQKSFKNLISTISPQLHIPTSPLQEFQDKMEEKSVSFSSFSDPETDLVIAPSPEKSNRSKLHFGSTSPKMRLSNARSSSKNTASNKFLEEPKKEKDNRDFYLPKQKRGGFTISKAPRFGEPHRNFDIDNLKAVKTFEQKNTFSLKMNN